jgi:hypothetical protein
MKKRSHRGAINDSKRLPTFRIDSVYSGNSFFVAMQQKTSSAVLVYHMLATSGFCVQMHWQTAFPLKLFQHLLDSPDGKVAPSGTFSTPAHLPCAGSPGSGRRSSFLMSIHNKMEQL